MPILKMCFDVIEHQNKRLLKMENEENMKLLQLVYRLFRSQKYLRGQDNIKIQKFC